MIRLLYFILKNARSAIPHNLSHIIKKGFLVILRPWNINFFYPALNLIHLKHGIGIKNG